MKDLTVKTLLQTIQAKKVILMTSIVFRNIRRYNQVKELVVKSHILAVYVHTNVPEKIISPDI